MNIDMTFDYDKLLEEAKKRYEELLKLDKEATQLFIDGDDGKKYWPVQQKFLAEQAKYRDWEKKNVDKLGVSLITDFENGTPIGIDAVISGHDNWGRGTH